ncbi:ATP-dependent RNA helicase DDX19A [Echinococcus granulosus]|uniref:RNA helicase n=2 Tax=Echinococcus granulosus TaxID=6210 RepID=W6UUB3_ECHGR|nr:ATP-dependent RNA helicase DDX19A [Echinococcus granulosus]EUB64928.1 ATP-dependent RNA helicase DDX19A [Echinococcus granulosus]
MHTLYELQLAVIFWSYQRALPAHLLSWHDLPDGSSPISHMVAGSCAGIMEHSVTYPTRLQCLRPLGAHRYISLTEGLKQLFRQEGFLRSFRGIGAVVFGAGPAHALYFGLYEHMKSILVSQTRPDSSYNHFAHALSGTCATVAHDAVMTPADAIKQRLQMFNSPYHNTLDCLRRVCRNEGFGILYRAYLTQLSTNVPFQCIQFMTYELLQQKLNPSKEYLPWTHIISGGLAGSTAAALTTPMDVCKTVLNTQTYGGSRPGGVGVSNEAIVPPAAKPVIRGLFGACRAVVQSQGAYGLFLGMNARVVAALPGTAISWSVYEYFKWALSKSTVDFGASPYVLCYLSMTESEQWKNLLAELKEIGKGVQPISSLSQDQAAENLASPAIDANSSDSSRLRCPNDDPSDRTDNEVSKAEKSYINKLLNTKLVETQASDIEMLREDPSNPLHSVKTFQDLKLDPRLLKGIAALGFYKPSAIQEKALPYLIGDSPRNMIAQAQSGTGKTATFLLAMLSRVDITFERCQCLCMAPTRELAIQIATVGREMSRFIPKIAFGLAIREEIPAVDQDGYVKSQIVIGTAGTVSLWMRGTGPYRLDPHALQMFVLDEADIMMEESGFLHTSRRIVQRLPKTCQLLLFSATYDEEVIEFARTIIPDPVEFRVRRNQLTLTNIKQVYLFAPTTEEKYDRLSEIYGSFHVGQAIIFCATRREASWLQRQMTRDGHKVVLLSGELDVRQREAVIEDFRKANFRVLITTNLCSRGLDVPQVNLVINWRLPLDRQGRVDCETYLHRIGRSGRFGKGGLAINFAGPADENLLQQIENHFDITIPMLTNETLNDL